MLSAAVPSPGRDRAALAPGDAPAQAEAVPRLALIPAPSQSRHVVLPPAVATGLTSLFAGVTAVESAAPKPLGSGENQLSCPWLIEDGERSTGSANSSCCGAHPCMGTPRSGCSGGKAGDYFHFVGTQQTKGLGALCLEQERLRSSKPEVRD